MVAGRHYGESARFLERALIDFGLWEEFEARQLIEQVECLSWVAEACDSDDEEQRVTRVLDDLMHGHPLPSQSVPWSNPGCPEASDGGGREERQAVAP